MEHHHCLNLLNHGKSTTSMQWTWILMGYVQQVNLLVYRRVGKPSHPSNAFSRFSPRLQRLLLPEAQPQGLGGHGCGPWFGSQLEAPQGPQPHGKAVLDFYWHIQIGRKKWNLITSREACSSRLAIGSHAFLFALLRQQDQRWGARQQCMDHMEFKLTLSRSLKV